MLIPNYQYSHLSYQDLLESARHIKYQLSKDWYIRIEYSTDIKYLNSTWEQWGEAMFYLADASLVVDKIFSCKMHNPYSEIRLHAEKYSPRSNLYYLICKNNNH